MTDETIEPKPCAHCGSSRVSAGPAGAEHKQRLQAWLERGGYESLTEAINYLMEVRFGNDLD